MKYKILADLIVVIHFAWLLFMLWGFILNLRGIFRQELFERWLFRTLHFLGISYVGLLAAMGRYCPLTLWENTLRTRFDPGLAYPGSFMIYYAERFIYPDINPLFIRIPTTIVTVFSILIFIIKPPQKIRRVLKMLIGAKNRAAVIALVMLCLCASASAQGQGLALSAQEIQRIGEKIFQNECSSKDEYLLQWNEGEDFLSVGIGHFIWYPQGRQGPFEESFVRLLDYLKSEGMAIPSWLDKTPYPGCPWNSRQDFLNSQADPRQQELTDFLKAAKSQQAVFIIRRLEEALPFILENALPQERAGIKRRFDLLASTAQGIYALVDYSHFKGFGIFPSERYKGQGWGLLQVLSGMKEEADSGDALKEFVAAAKAALEQRVNNAPIERNEQRWLPGWRRRVDSYLDIFP